MILSRFEKTDDDGMKEVKQWVASMESSLQRLEQTEAKYQTELDAALAQFRELAGEAESMDKAELAQRRQFLRNPNTQDTRSRLQQAHGKEYSVFTTMEAEQDVENLLLEDEKGWRHRCKNRLPDASRNPEKSIQTGTTKNNVKSRENQEKSDSEFPNDTGIIGKLSIRKSPLFSGSRDEENLRETGGFPWKQDLPRSKRYAVCHFVGRRHFRYSSFWVWMWSWLA